MKKIGYIIFALIFFSLLSCSKIAPERDPAACYLLLPAEPGTLNPITATDTYSAAIYGYIYESLIDRDEDSLALKPDLAERWEISPDGLRYRFYLKKGVLWSDGVEFTADDIIYSYNKIMDPKVPSAQLKVYYKDIKSLKKIDKYTVEFLYAEPYFSALEICGGMTIIPKHIFDNGTNFLTHKNNRFPVGTGLYKFEKWDTGKQIVISRNERYRDKKPEIKKIVYKFITEENIAFHMFKKGELDIMQLRAIQWVRQTNSDEFNRKFYRLKYYLPNFRYIGWNGKLPVFQDKRVRRAMTHLINRQAMLDKLLFGLGKIVTGNFYINSKSYNHNVRPIPYDPKKGVSLLKEAGWIDHNNDGILDKDGKKFTFSITIPSGISLSERIATIVKEDLSKVGIEVDIYMYEWAVFLQKIQKREFDAVILGWSLGYNSDPYQLWHSSQVKDGSNYCNFINAEADKIIETARRELTEARRIKLFHRFHEIIDEEQPYTFLFCTPELKVVNRKFDNVKVHTTGLKIEEWKVKIVP